MKALGRDITVDQLRPEVAAFACAMEERLQRCAPSVIADNDRRGIHARYSNACADIGLALIDAQDGNGRRTLEHAVDAAIEAMTIANIAGAFR